MGGELDSNTAETHAERIRGEEEDACLAFDVGLEPFTMSEYTMSLIKITLLINKLSGEMSPPLRGLL